LSGWLIAAWLLALFACYTLWWNIAWARRQRSTATQRPNLDQKAYIDECRKSGIGAGIAAALYRCLLPLCVKGVLPNPDDGLLGFYFDDGEDLEDLLEKIFEKLGLLPMERYAPQITGSLESARFLGIFLQARMSAGASFTRE
jgi:hypothetical protein